MKYLFMGGDHDGEWVELSHPQEEIRLESKARCPLPGNTFGETGAFSYQSYRRVEVVDEDRKSYFVYIGGGNVNQPLKRMMEGYKREPLIPRAVLETWIRTLEYFFKILQQPSELGRVIRDLKGLR